MPTNGFLSSLIPDLSASTVLPLLSEIHPNWIVNDENSQANNAVPSKPNTPLRFHPEKHNFLTIENNKYHPQFHSSTKIAIK